MSYNSACIEQLLSLLSTLYIHSLCASRHAELARGQHHKCMGCTAWGCIPAWDCIAWGCIAWGCIAWGCITWSCIEWGCIAWGCIALDCIAWCCIAWGCIAYVALHRLYVFYLGGGRGGGNSIETRLSN